MPEKQKIVISASRRTDIPAFYMDWFIQQIETGQFEVINPYNQKKSFIPATADRVSTIVFWSKNFAPFIKNNHGIILKKMGYNLFFNFTLNSPDPVLEPCLPTFPERLAQLETLAESFGSRSINWRFDPLFFYKKNGIKNDPLSHFSEIAKTASDIGVKNCITSFADIYKKVKTRCKFLNKFEITSLLAKEKNDLLLQMANKLSKYHINLKVCCEKELVLSLPADSEIKESACIDNHLLKKIFCDNISIAKDSGQRKGSGCLCNKSYDIGSYSLHPCFHNCVYCYANPQQKEQELYH